MMLIKNENELNDIEKNCIIASHCRNKDYREFFAEVVYHADALDGLLGGFKYNNALIADMTCYKSGSDFIVERVILDCTANNLKYTKEELTPIYNELKEKFPDLSFEIWTIYGDIT